MYKESNFQWFFMLVLWDKGIQSFLFPKERTDNGSVVRFKTKSLIERPLIVYHFLIGEFPGIQAAE